jgi:hypothetical protein
MPTTMAAKRHTSTLVLFIALPVLDIMTQFFIDAPAPVVCHRGME